MNPFQELILVKKPYMIYLNSTLWQQEEIEQVEIQEILEIKKYLQTFDNFSSEKTKTNTFHPNNRVQCISIGDFQIILCFENGTQLSGVKLYKSKEYIY